MTKINFWTPIYLWLTHFDKTFPIIKNCLTMTGKFLGLCPKTTTYGIFVVWWWQSFNIQVLSVQRLESDWWLLKSGAGAFMRESSPLQTDSLPHSLQFLLDQFFAEDQKLKNLQ